jgi:hypothetical protein
MKIFSIFLAFYLFVPHDKLFSGFILNLENAEMLSPPDMPVSEAEAAAALSECPRVTGKELAALPAAVSHGAAPPCRSRRAACHPRSLLVIVPELRHSSSSHAV